MNPNAITLNFDATTVEPSVPFSAVPAGDYTVILSNAKVEQTKDKANHYLKLEFTIQDGEYKGRKLFDNLNLWHQGSQQAAEIAWRQLSGLCHATGVLQVATVDQLFNIPVVVKVTTSNDEKYGQSNELKGFSKANGMGGVPDWNAPGDPSANPPWMQAGGGAAPAAQPPAQQAAPWQQPGAQQQPPAQQAAPAQQQQAPATTAAPPWAQNGAPAAQQAAPSSVPPWQR